MLAVVASVYRTHSQSIMHTNIHTMAAVKVAVQQLLAGCLASTVIVEMRKTYTTPESMKKHMSLVRSKIIEGGHYSKECDLAPLRAFAAVNPEVATFLAANLKQQCKTQREHKFTPTWSEEAEKCLADLKLLPAALDDFVMSKANICTIKRRAATRLREKLQTSSSGPSRSPNVDSRKCYWSKRPRRAALCSRRRIGSPEHRVAEWTQHLPSRSQQANTRAV